MGKPIKPAEIATEVRALTIKEATDYKKRALDLAASMGMTIEPEGDFWMIRLGDKNLTGGRNWREVFLKAEGLKKRLEQDERRRA